MIFHEVLRVYPPVAMLPRVVYKDTQVWDMYFPAGVQVVLPTILVHHDHEIWGMMQRSLIQRGLQKEFWRQQKTKFHFSIWLGSSGMHWKKICNDGGKNSFGNDLTTLLIWTFAILCSCFFQYPNYATPIWCTPYSMWTSVLRFLLSIAISMVYIACMSNINQELSFIHRHTLKEICV